MAQATFGYEGISVRAVPGRDEDIQWLEEFLAPWFSLSDEALDIELKVSQDPARYQQISEAGPAGANIIAFMMDTNYKAYPTWNGPGQTLTFNDERRKLFCLVDNNHVELVCQDPAICTRTMVMRIIREYAMGASQLTGGRFLHASAFAVKGLAAIITGPRQAGKTSLLSYILANSDAAYLSNDRVLLKDIGHSTRVRGMPTIVSVREGTMNMFPGMEQTVVERRYTKNATLEECKDPVVSVSPQPRRGRYSLSPSQFSAMLDAQPVKEARARVVIFPRQTRIAGGLELRRLDPQEARNRLEASLFGHIHPDQLSEVFTRHPVGEDIKPAPGDHALLDILSRSLTAYECVLGNDAYADRRGVEELLRLLEPGVCN